MNSDKPLKILIVEDEAPVAMEIEDHLVDMGYRPVGPAASQEKALEIADRERPDLVLVDIHLGRGGDGIETALRLRERHDLRVIYLTAFSDDQTLDRAKPTRPLGFLIKPFTGRTLRATIEVAVHALEADRELERRAARLEELVAERTAALAATNVRLAAELEERRRAEAAVHDREQHLRDFLDNATDLIQSVGSDGRILYTNAAWRKTLGYTEEETAGLNIFDRIAPDCREHCGANFQRLMRGEDCGLIEMVLLSKEGHPVALEGSVNVRFEQGVPVSTRGIFRDVTQRRAAEASLRLFRALLDRVEDAVEVIDPATGRFVDVNERSCLELGYTRAEMLALTVADVDSLAEISTPGWRITGHPAAGPRTFESIYRRKDGTTFPVEISYSEVSLDRDYRVAVVRNITRRKRAEEALRESEEKFERLFRTAPTATALYRMEEGRFADVNEQFVALFGIPRAEAVGRSGLTLGLWRDPAARERFLNTLHGQDFLNDFPARLCRRTGPDIDALLSAQVIDLATGPVVLIQATDITAQKRTEAALRESEVFSRTVINTLPQSLFVKDRNSVFVMVNEACAREMNRTPEDFVGKDDSAFHQPDLAEKYRADDQAVLTGGEVRFFEEKHNVPGADRWVRGVKAPIRNAAGEITSLLGVFWDVTAEKRALDDLRDSNENLAITLRSIGDAVLVTDRQRRITRMNPIAEQLTGWTEAEALGRPIEEVFHILNEETRGPAVIPVDDVLATGEIHGLANHTALRTRDGREISIADSAAPIRDSKGYIVGVVLVFRDETRERQQRRTIERQREMLAEIRAVQEQFITATDPAHAFERLLATLLRFTQSESGLLGEVLWTPEGAPRLRPQAVAGLAGAAPEESECFGLQPLVDSVLAAGKTVIAHAPACDPHRDGPPAELPPLRASLGIPIKAGGEWVGMIALANRPGDYTEEVAAEIEPLLATYGNLLTARRSQLEREAAEARLRDRETLLSSINANLADSAVCRLVFSPDGKMSCSYVSPNMETILGVPSGEFLANPGLVFAVTVPEDLAALRDANRRAFESGVTTSTVFRVPDRKGGVRWLHFRAHLVERLPDGRQVRDGVATDVTALKEAEAAVRRVNENLERLVEERSRELAASEHRFRQLYENSPVGIYQTTPDGRILLANPALLKMLGYESFEALSRRNLEAEGFAESTSRREFKEAIERDGAVLGRESAWSRADGSTVIVRENTQAVRDAAGHITAYDGVVEDITLRRRAEEELKGAHHRTFVLAQLGRELAEADTPRAAALAILEAADQIFGWDSSWFQFWNGEQQVFENPVTFDDFDGERREVPSDPESLRNPGPATRRAMRDGEYLHLRTNETEGTAGETPFGTQRRSLSRMFVAIRRNDRLIGVLSIQSYRLNAYDDDALKLLRTLGDHCAGAMDRIQTRLTLNATEARYQRVVDNIGDALMVDDPEGRVVFANRQFLDLFRLTQDDLADLRIEDYVAPEFRMELRDRHSRRLAGEPVPDHFEYEGIAKDGVRRWLEVRVTKVMENGVTVGTQSAIRDISERRRAEQALKESLAQLQTAQNIAHLGVYATDLLTNTWSGDPAADSILGVETGSDRTFSRWRELIHPDDRERLFGLYQKSLENHEEFTFAEYRIMRGGEVRWIAGRGQNVYGPKGEPIRQVGVIQDITERKQAELALRASEERFDLAMRAANDGLWDWDMRTQVVYFSPRWKAMLGYADPELESSFAVWERLVDDEGRAKTMALIQECVAGRAEGFSVEFRMRHKDGHWVEILARATLIRDENGAAVRMVGTHVDITERKTAEATLKTSQERLRAIIAATPSCIKLLDAAGNLVEMNRQGLELIEADAFDQVRGQCVYPILGPEHREAFRQFNEQVCAGHPGSLEFEIVGLHGTTRWVHTSAVPMLDPATGQTLHLGITQDITERRRAAEALKQSEQSYREIFNSVTDAIFIHDANTGVIVDVNDTMVRIYGYSDRKELVGLHPNDIGYGESPYGFAEASEWMRKAMTEGPQMFEWCAHRKDGQPIWVEVALRSATINGQPRVLAVVRDNTERRRANEALKQSQQNYREIFNSVNDAVFIHDAHTGAILDANDSMLKLFGLTPAEAQQLAPNDTSLGESPYSAAEAAEWMRKTLQEGPQVFEWHARKKSGELFWVEVSLRSAIISGQPRVLAVVRDITERKRDAEALRRNEQEMRAILDGVDAYIYMKDTEGRYLFANAAVCRLWQTKLENVIGFGDEKYFDATTVANIRTVDRRVLVGGESLRTEETHTVSETGRSATYLSVKLPLRREDGSIYALCGISTDITERKQSEMEIRRLLQEATERDFFLRQSQHVGQIGGWRADPVNNTVLWTEGVYEIVEMPLDYKPDLETGLDFYLPESRVQVVASLKQTLETGVPFSIQVQVRGAKSGVAKWTELRGQPHRDEQGRVDYLMGTLQDISRQKEQEAKYRSLFEHASDGIFLMDETGFVDCNAQGAALYGLPREKIIGRFPADFSPERQPDGRLSVEVAGAAVQKVMSGAVQRLEWVNAPVDGRAVNVEITLSRLDMGDKAYIQAMVRDTTERKRAEEVQRESASRLRAIVEATPVPVALNNDQGEITYLNPAFVATFGYTTGDIPTLADWWPLAYPDVAYREQVASAWGEHLERARRTGTHFEPMEITIRAKDGRPRVVIASAAALHSGVEGEHMVALFDITERKQAEAALRASEEKYRGIFDDSVAAIYVFDDHKRFIDTNDAGLEMLGYDREELLRLSIPDVDADPVVVQPAHGQLLSGGRLRNYEHKLRRKDGAIITVLNNSRPVPGPDGTVIGMQSTLIDISERKRAEQTLRRSEQALKEAQRLARLGNWELDLRGNRLVWSDEIFRIFEIDQARFDASYEAFLNAIHPDDREAVNSAYANSLETRQPYSIRHRLQMADGRIKHVQEQCQTEYDNTGTPLRSVGTVQDITELVLAEVALQESRSLLQTVIDHVPMRVFWKDRDLNYLGCNPAFARDAGKDSPADLVGHDDYQMGWAPEADTYRADDRKVIGSGIARINFEEPQTTPDGQTIWLRTSKVPLRNTEDEVIGVIGIYEDITERKQAEVRLHESEARHRHLVESAHDWIWEIDLKTGFTYCSPQCQDILGYAPGELLGKMPFELMPPEEAGRARGFFEAMITRPQLFRGFEHVSLHRDGRQVQVETNGVPVLDANGHLVGYRGMNRDITERKKAEQAIQRLNAELEQRVVERTAQLQAANRELSSFNYSVSHDLRAPLRGIEGWSLALVEDYGGVLDERGRGYLGRVRSEAERMGQLIEDMLKLSRLNQAPMSTEKVNLSAVALAVASRLRETGSARAVEWTVAPNMGVQGDPGLLRIALENLLENAWKFTGRQSSARIEVGQRQEKGERVFFVRDNGAGFDPAFASKLFAPFQRMHTQAEFPGTGIGLATVQRIISRHGGRIWAEAAVDQGATFYFTLPARPESASL